MGPADGVVDVDLRAARGDDGRLVGADADAEDRRDDGGGALEDDLGRRRGRPSAALAPWSIHRVMVASSSGVSASSLRGGMNGRTAFADSLTSEALGPLAGR